ADLLVYVHDELHLLRLGVELDEVGVDAVLGGADVQFAVEAGDEGEVAGLLVGVLGGDLVRLAEDPRGGLAGGQEGGEEEGEHEVAPFRIPGEPEGVSPRSL